jgi:uncharacterized protein
LLGKCGGVSGQVKYFNFILLIITDKYMDQLFQPWPWYVSGPIAGITVPLLLLLGNKRLGVSSSLRHICAACMPNTGIALFSYNWRSEIWSLLFVLGILIGGFVGGILLSEREAVVLSAETSAHLQTLGIDSTKSALMPVEIFNWNTLFSLKGFLMIVGGGFMVGFGTRYAQGCTSGHGIFGLAILQWPSLVAIVSFFVGGIVFSHLVLPFILSL